MPETPEETAELMHFRKCLVRLLESTRAAQAEQKPVAREHGKQMEVLVRKARKKSA
jgi:hypothetical protein